MPTEKPPKGWEVGDTANTAWGTDIDRTESVTQTGAYALHFINTTPSVDPYMVTKLIPVESAVPIWYGALWRVDSIAAGNWVEVGVTGIGASRVGSLGTSSVQTTLAATGTWQWVGEVIDLSNAGAFDIRWLRFHVKKNNTAFNAYMDHLSADQWVSSWGRRLSANQSIPDSTWTTVDFDSQDRTAGLGGGFSIPEVRCSEAAGVITIGHGGPYAISAVVEFDTMTNGATVEIRIKIVSGAVTLYRPGQYETVAAGDKTRVVVSSAIELLNPGDTVEIEVWHDEGGAVNVVPGTATRNTYFRGARTGIL